MRLAPAADMMRVHSLRLSIPLAAVVLVGACHDTTGLTDGPAILFSGAYNVTDTVGLTLSQGLVAEVHDSSGRLAPPGTLVRFTTVNDPGGHGYVTIQPSGATFSASTVDVLTDASGHAAVLVTLGQSVGTARIVVTVPGLGLTEVSNYVINAGHPARVTVTPIDTGVYIGTTTTLHGTAVDRYGNALADPVTWSGPSAGVTVSSAGVVTGVAYGRYRVKGSGANGGITADSVRVNVVPHGRLLAVEGHSGGNVLYAYDADGSNRVVLTSSNRPGFGAWIPGTSGVAIEQASQTQRIVTILGTGGPSRPLLATPPATLTNQADPAPSADGKWIYFVASGSWCPAPATSCIARAMLDGSGLELVVPTTSSDPSPSPDGSKVAYANVFNYNPPSTATLRVFDAATKTPSAWSVAGRYPTWSPDGSQIAYVTAGNTIGFIAPDGTGARTLTATQAMGGGPQVIQSLYGWSPDGKWLLANGNLLVEVATGVSIPIGYATGALVMSIR